MKTSIERTANAGAVSARRFAVAATLVSASAAPWAESIYAQPAPASKSVQVVPPRAPASKSIGVSRLKYLLIGAGGGALLATVYYGFSDRGRTASSCGPLNCAMPYLTLTGAFIGLFSAKDLAATKRAEAPRVGAVLTFNTTEVPLIAIPLGFSVRDSLIAVVTDSGAQILSAAAKPLVLRRRGVGLSDMRQVALRSSSPEMLLGTGVALWEGSAGAGQLTRAYDGPIDALASDDAGVLGASGTTIFYRRGSGATATIDSTRADAPVTAAAFDKTSGHFWIATDSSLAEIEVAPGSVKVARKFALPAKALSIAVSPQWIALALGSDGIAAWKRDGLAAPVVTPVRIRDEPRFAFDAAFIGEDLYVAGGVDGLFRLTLSPVPQVLGSSRQIRYATALRAENGVLWVGDRSRKAIIRVTTP